MEWGLFYLNELKQKTEKKKKKTKAICSLHYYFYTCFEIDTILIIPIGTFIINISNIV